MLTKIPLFGTWFKKHDGKTLRGWVNEFVARTIELCQFKNMRALMASPPTGVEEWVRAAALYQLGAAPANHPAFSAPSTVAYWQNMLNNPERVLATIHQLEAACQRAAEQFGHLGSPAVPVLLSALRKKRFGGRVRKIGPDEFKKMMPFEHPYFRVVAALVVALGSMGAAANSAVPALRELSNHPHPEIRAAAAAALAKIESPATATAASRRAESPVPCPPGDREEVIRLLQVTHGKIARLGPPPRGPGHIHPGICMNIQQAIEALRTGVDPNGRPITAPQIGAGLMKLTAYLQQPGWSWLASAAVSDGQMTLLKTYVYDLEQIARMIAG